MGLTNMALRYIGQQKIFFVGTAAATGKVNISPKGGDSLRVLNSCGSEWSRLYMLGLPKEDQEALMLKLMLSLGVQSAADVEQEWLAVAESRMVALDDGAVEAIPGERVMAKAKNLV